MVTITLFEVLIAFVSCVMKILMSNSARDPATRNRVKAFKRRGRRRSGRSARVRASTVCKNARGDLVLEIGGVQNTLQVTHQVRPNFDVALEPYRTEATACML